MKTILIKVFNDIDLRCGHKGLSKIAREHNISISKLKKGEFVAFLNNTSTGVKLLTTNNILVYLKAEKGVEIDISIIKALPTFFNGTEFSYHEGKRLGLRKVA